MFATEYTFCHHASSALLLSHPPALLLLRRRLRALLSSFWALLCLLPPWRLSCCLRPLRRRLSALLLSLRLSPSSQRDGANIPHFDYSNQSKVRWLYWAVLFMIFTFV